MPEQRAPAAYLSTKYGFDDRDGRQVPRLVVSGQFHLTGVHQGSVHLESGPFTLVGTLQGTLDVQSGVTVYVFGTLQGSLVIAGAATVIVSGVIQGSTYLARGATLVIEPSGKLAGAVHNDGLLTVRGVLGGPREGSGVTRFEGKGFEKKPIFLDGISYYEW